MRFWKADLAPPFLLPAPLASSALRLAPEVVTDTDEGMAVKKLRWRESAQYIRGNRDRFAQ